MASTSKNTMQNLASEFIGTYLLVLTVGCNVLGGSGTWAALSIASVLMVSVYSLGSVSGGHFNPAVTLALTIAGKHGDASDAAGYMATQIVAGVLAGLSYVFVHKKSFNLEPGTGFTGLEAGAVEVLYTFMLCFVVLRVACSNNTKLGSAAPSARTEGNENYGLAIGFVIVAGGYGGGWISKGAFNPAVAIGIDVASASFGVYWCFLYTVFEFVGAALAAFVWKQLDEDLESDKYSTGAIFLSEFLGTFYLVLTVGLNVLGQSPAPALSIAAALMCMIYALASVSGAHFNPAVTVACGINSGDWSKAHIYVAAQLLGGLVAGLIYSGITGSSVPLGPGAGHTWGAAAFAEIMYTFVLRFVVLNGVATLKAAGMTDTFYGLAVGFCIVAGGYAIGSVSGGSLNPAVSFGLDTSHAMKGGSWMNCLAYTAFELTGGALAAGATKFCAKASKEGLLPFVKGYGAI